MNAQAVTVAGRAHGAIDWKRLAAAFGDDTFGVQWYLHLPSGEVVRVIGDDEGAPALSAGDGYIALDRARSKEQYRWMERFIVALDDRALAAELAHAIAGKRAFQRFKLLLAEHPGRSREWFAFRIEQLGVHMHKWLEANALLELAQDLKTRGIGTSLEPALQRIPRHAQLDAMIDDLAPDDLQSLLALAEYLRANSQARLSAREAAE